MKYVVAFLVVMGIGLMACGGGGQSDACAKMIACQTALADAIEGYTATDYDSTYGEEGTCWDDTDVGDACTLTCESYNDSMDTAIESYVTAGTIEAAPDDCKSE